MTPTKTVFGATLTVRTAGDWNDVMRAYCSKLLLLGAVWLVVASPGCRQPSEQKLAEQKAIARHEQDIRQQATFQETFRQIGAAKMAKAARFFVGSAHNGRMPGLSPNSHGTMRMEKLPVISPNGPYFLSGEVHLITSDSPPGELLLRHGADLQQ
jgi:hypothetical protein